MYAQSCSQYASWSLLITLFALFRMYKFFSAIVNSFHQDDVSLAIIAYKGVEFVSRGGGHAREVLE